MKYVILIVDNKQLGIRRAYPAIFPEYMAHATMAAFYAKAIKDETREDAFVMSAGFCEFFKDSVRCFRGSESLKIKEDHKLSQLDTEIMNLPNAMQGVMR